VSSEFQSAKLNFALAGFFALVLIVTSGGSFAMTFSLASSKGWLYALVPYVIPFALMCFVGFGIALIRKATAPDIYVESRSLTMLSGLLCFIFGFGLSVAGSIHGLHHYARTPALQSLDLDRALRDLNSARAEKDANIDLAVQKYRQRVDAALSGVIKECKNQQNPGCGPNYLDRKRELDQALGVEVKFVSAKDVGARPTLYAVEEFQASVNGSMNDQIKNIRGKARELDELLKSAPFAQTLAQLDEQKRVAQIDNSDALDSLLQKAFALRNDLHRMRKLLDQSLGVSRPSATDLTERPPSTELRSLWYFWSEALKPTTTPRLVSVATLIFCAIFGIVFELAFTAFFYNGLRAREEY
jgi:hypothetical protein